MITYTILPELSLCVFTLPQTVLSSEIINEIQSYIADVKWRPHHNILIDLRLPNTTLSSETYVAVRKVIISLPNSKEARYALVASGDSTKSTINKWARELKAQKTNCRAYTSIDGTLAWLEVPTERYNLLTFYSKL